MVVSARGQEPEKIAALDAGADDYVTKPFAMGELMARMRVALRHRARLADGAVESVVEVGGLTLDLAKREVRVEGARCGSRPPSSVCWRCWRATAGACSPTISCSRRCGGRATCSHHHNLRVCMSQLRHKLEPEPSRPRLLLTEPGVGYRLRED